jgi:Flp pilus assembly protein TadG
MEMIKLARRWSCDRGSELIEFAIVAPILILLAAGIFEFGMMFRTFEAVTNAAREGARVGVLPGYELPVNVDSRVNAYLTAAGLTGPHTTVSPVITVTTTAGTFSARRVVVTYPYTPAVLAPIAAFFGGSFGTIPLIGAAVMRTEAQATP